MGKEYKSHFLISFNLSIETFSQLIDKLLILSSWSLINSDLNFITLSLSLIFLNSFELTAKIILSNLNCLKSEFSNDKLFSKMTSVLSSLISGLIKSFLIIE